MFVAYTGPMAPGHEFVSSHAGHPKPGPEPKHHLGKLRVSCSVCIWELSVCGIDDMHVIDVIEDQVEKAIELGAVFINSHTYVSCKK